MADEYRITHALAEVLRDGDPDVRITHALVEVLRQGYATYTQTIDIDAILKKTGITKVSQIDAFLKALGQLETISIDVILNAISKLATLEIDAVLQLLPYEDPPIDDEVSAKATNYRVVVPAAKITKTVSFIRILFRANSVFDGIFNGVSIGARSGETEDFVSEPIRVTFNGGYDYVTIDAGTDKWSDWFLYDLDKTIDHMVHVFQFNEPHYYKDKNGGPTYFKEIGVDESLIVDISGYSSNSKNTHVAAIEGSYTSGQTLNIDVLLKALLLTETISLDAILQAIDIATALSYGEETPTEGETTVGWDTWSDGAGGTPTIVGDATWGKIQLLTGEIAHGPVYNIGAGTHNIKFTENKYGSGTGDFKIYIRGQAGVFTQDAETPSWEEYTTQVIKTWEYVQVKLEGN